jgi:hypothetical protein
MASGFDPYYKWLAIPPEEQPPNYYRLLGLRHFESDPEVIEAASDQRMAFLRTFQAGQYSALSQKLLNEVAGAKVCLLSPEKRAGYDAALRNTASVDSSAPDLSPAAPPIAADKDNLFDFGQLGVSGDAGSSRIGRARSHSRPEAGGRSGHRILIATMALCAVLLAVVTAVVSIARNQRIETLLTAQGNPSSADPPATGEDKKGARTNPDTQNVPTDKASKPPVPIAPASGATLPNPDPPGSFELQWNPVAHASRYWVRVETPHNPKPLVDSNDLSDATLEVRLRHQVQRENCHGWRWQVRAMVDGRWTDWSEPRKFDLAEPAAWIAEAPVADKKAPLASPQVATDKPAGPEDRVAAKPVPAKPAEPEKPIGPQPLPDEAARKQAGQAVLSIYKKQLITARTPEEHLVLADEMLRKADDSDSDPAAQYALMDRARAQSASAGDAGRALDIIDQIGQRFQIEPLRMKVETLTKTIQDGTQSLDRDHEIGDSVLDVMQQLGRAEKFDAAAQLGSLYHDHIRRPFNGDLIRRVAAQVKVMREDQAELTKIEGPRNVLKGKPDDPEANAAVGRYLCFIRGDWEAGLPILAKGTASPLARLARLESAAAETPAARLKLADAWWDQAEKEPAGASKLAHYRRARHWYEACAEDLSGPDRAKAQKRTERIGRMGQTGE